MVKTTPAAPDVQTKLDIRAGQYIKVRDALKTLKARHEEEEKPLVEMMNLLQGYFQGVLDSLGAATSVKTKSGTVIASTRYTASLVNADAFMRHVIGTESWDLLDRRANATAVRDFVEKNSADPSSIGVKLTALKTIGVRRPSGGAGKDKDDAAD